MNISAVAASRMRYIRDRSKIVSDLMASGFKPKLTGITVFTLSRLSAETYNDLQKFLGDINGRIKSQLKLTQPQPLELPWFSALKTVDFKALRNKPEAMKEVFDRCVEVDGFFAPRVDLSILPWIYKTYVFNPQPQK
ncbi:hypothetical protein A2625_01540 [candidate division WOR-1 bacterium RIFCSPHIGHO2_01_FULL_53_15]|uniref:Uncharacterized protein n=1 Tax=candidate division WOR-1 bacterium RIFCSPHIGHO2_01_FULL_53_15 TaxID=1802564 RepID=A0A1F4Q2A3_UNCSA|nr:MAG: hypothetical protein A2625_01540 [candidate division WOR-1 bacterium RIFCSPHIGHO2_01_FULL_53_15]OGC13659.1 MAG: hypothetical protein A3D23_06465 [candidate division WOR-1 bacterium RIFCSPHIGHO2_02_FULL_53_26]